MHVLQHSTRCSYRALSLASVSPRESARQPRNIYQGVCIGLTFISCVQLQNMRLFRFSDNTAPATPSSGTPGPSVCLGTWHLVKRHQIPCDWQSHSTLSNICSFSAEAASASAAVTEPVAEAPSSQHMGQPSTSNRYREPHMHQRYSGETRDRGPKGPRRYPVRLTNLSQSVTRSDVARFFSRFNITENDIRCDPPALCYS
jgi:hypothetical protein